MNHPMVDKLRLELGRTAPFFVDQVDRNLSRFGDEWARELDALLARMFPDDTSFAQAVRGYCEFALDGMRLMKRFEKEHAYVAKTYAQAAAEVYHNRDYMLNLYLPGILLSNYLWPHHYRQMLFLKTSFLRDLHNSQEGFFYDVGIGTGFYSRYLLESAPGARGIGFDISDFSIQYARKQLEAYNCQSRYQILKQNVITEPILDKAPFLISVEVLEHLEEPLPFLKALRGMLRPGGKAFITAAITAPNADHIYLYRNTEEVLVQLKEAGFKLEQYFCAAGYLPRHEEPVPQVAAYVVC
jgi:2-polyprenyl-3-methyl-5-hydroxy-6-metoxy-1,4-benzoquinol methylase